MNGVTVMVLLATAAGLVVTLTSGLVLYAQGVRNGSQAGDVTLHAATAAVAHPEGIRHVAVATVHNPGPVGVMIGLSVRPARTPGWLTGPVHVRVPHRTARARLLAGQHLVVGVVDAGRTARWELPLPGRQAPRRLWVVLVAGQAGRRLRVVRRLAGDGLAPQAGGHTAAGSPGDGSRPGRCA